jgi:hypothetical protein
MPKITPDEYESLKAFFNAFWAAWDARSPFTRELYQSIIRWRSLNRLRR